MEEYEYLIIGGGMAADSAVRGIRENDPSGRICILSQDEYSPYDRPPLTKGLWFGKPMESIWRKTEKEHVTMCLKCKALSIDPQQKIVFAEGPQTYRYKKLLLATGGIPKKLNCPDEGVIYFRTAGDYLQLRSLYEIGSEFVVIGSGFIGTEIAAALSMNGKKVTLIFREPQIGLKLFPKGFSDYLNAYFIEKGITLVPEQSISSVAKTAKGFVIKTSKGESFVADGVIAGIGISPATELAETASLKIENGIVVDRFLQTSSPDIFAAGDVANFYCPQLEKHLRCEHEDAANTLGHTAGLNMTGAQVPYTHLPFFYSDLFELSYEAVGEISADMDIIEDWENPYQKGALYYLRNGQLRGAMFVGIWNQIDRARELIASKSTIVLQNPPVS